MSNYKNDIREYHDNTGLGSTPEISFPTLIETLVVLYASITPVEGPTIAIAGKDLHLPENKLNNILDDILTPDGTNLAYFIMNTPGAREKLKWVYDTHEGQSYIRNYIQI